MLASSQHNLQDIMILVIHLLLCVQY